MIYPDELSKPRRDVFHVTHTFDEWAGSAHHELGHSPLSLPPPTPLKEVLEAGGFSLWLHTSSTVLSLLFSNALRLA